MSGMKGEIVRRDRGGWISGPSGGRARPRAECPYCRRQVAVRVNGALRQHTLNRGNSHVCFGSGRVAAVERGRLRQTLPGERAR